MGKNSFFTLSTGLFLFHTRHEIPGFKYFPQTVNPFNYPEDVLLGKLWLFHFQYSFSESDCEVLEGCSLNASLGDVLLNLFDSTMSDSSYTIHNAVYVVAHTLHEMILRKTDPGSEGNRVHQVLLP